MSIDITPPDDVTPDDINFYLSYKRDESIWSDITISSSIKKMGFKEAKEAVPLKELRLYYAIKLLENNSEPTSKGSQLRFKKSDDVAYQDDDFRKSIIKMIEDARELLIRENKNLSDYNEKDNVFANMYLGIYTKDFWGPDAKKNKRNVKSYQEILVISESIEKWKSYLKDNNITKEILTKASSNNSKGYKAQTVTGLKKMISNEISGNLATYISDSNRLSRITTKVVEILTTLNPQFIPSKS